MKLRQKHLTTIDSVFHSFVSVEISGVFDRLKKFEKKKLRLYKLCEMLMNRSIKTS